jgi:integrase
MSRDRHQKGRVEAVGTTVRKWRGHYYVYEVGEDGAEVRRHKTVDLGPRATVKKWEAEKALQEIIDRATGATAKATSAVSLRWFWENRYRPMREATWKESSRSRTVRNVENYVLAAFGDSRLDAIDKFQVQTHLNALAAKFSRSVVQKARVYLKAILEEAVEQDLLAKNPARRLEMPETRRPSARFLLESEIVELLAAATGRDRLILRMFLILGLRPGELFALRRDDRVSRCQIRIDESIAGGKAVAPKTEGSRASVWIPEAIARELDFHMETMEDQRPEAFLFAARGGRPLDLCNFLNQRIKPTAARALKAMEAAGREIPAGFLQGINHQAFRRTCATYFQTVGTVKDAQAHLRHTTAAMTLGVYTQEIPESVRAAVEGLDSRLFPAVAKNSLVQ